MDLYFIFYFVAMSINFVHSSSSCEKTSACSCKFSNGESIDLSQLANNDNTPRFADQADPNSNADSYSWNPCQPFTEGSCNDVAVCNIHNNVPIPSYFPLGNQDSASFSTSGGVTKITYIYQGTGSASRTAEITLTCDKGETGQFIVIGEDPQGSGKYFFELKTKYACVSGLSAGTIIVIVFFAVLVLYFAIGVVIQIFVRKASGKERIPNYTLWVSLPSLVKDGTLYVVTFGKRKGYSTV